MFKKYMHLERVGTSEVEGIEVGINYIFPKLDGTNASVWLELTEEDGYVVQAGSRNRQLVVGADNAGFLSAMLKDIKIAQYLTANPTHVLYGEWLVPHSLKTYQEDAWNKFYIFDVFDRIDDRFLPYEEYAPLVKEHKLDFLSPLAIIKNGSLDKYITCLEKNTVLIKDGFGVGEGIVIKNYDYINKFGRVVWAKLITNSFKEAHHKEMGAPIIGGRLAEEDIVDKYITSHIVNKVVAKIELQHGGWQSKFIPQLLNVVWYDFIKEEFWEVLKEYKNPTISFSTLHKLTTLKIKELRKDIF